MENDRVEIPGSELPAIPNAQPLASVSESQQVTVTVLLRRDPHGRTPSADDLLSGKYQVSSQSEKEARAALAAAPQDLEAVRSFATECGLTVLSADAQSRRVRLEGSVTAIEKAFGVRLQETPEHHLMYSGAISVPRNLGGIIVSVLGLDQRPVAAPRHQ